MSLLPDPPLLGLPSKFAQWRPEQDRAVVAALDSPKRFVGISAPTGFGKSAMYMAIAALSGRRTAVLTANKGLETQLVRDFAPLGLVDIQGMQNYPCRELLPKGRFYGKGLRHGQHCDAGPCRAGARCRFRHGGCDYFDAFAKALRSQLLVTNYTKWLVQSQRESLGPFSLLVCDEVDHAPDEVTNVIQIDLSDVDLRNVLGIDPPPPSEDSTEWIQWANEVWPDAQSYVAHLEAEVRSFWRDDLDPPHALRQELYEARDQAERVKSVATMASCWVVERSPRSARLSPVWPRSYVEDYLFLNIPKVILVSATVRPKTLELLGLKPEDYEFLEFASSFPVGRRPVIHVETVRCQHTWSESDQLKWVRRLDQIIDRRLDRKGLVHTTSFARRELILEHSRHKEIMLFNNGKNTREVVEQFKKAAAPVVLVSPSLVSGWDFPLALCEYIVIGKIPFPDSRNRVTKARSDEDPEYAPFLAMLTLVQASGRGMRSADDSCEVLIIDDHFVWFFPKFKRFAPSWFIQAVRWDNCVPDPLPKLIPKEQR